MFVCMYIYVYIYPFYRLVMLEFYDLPAKNLWEFIPRFTENKYVSLIECIPYARLWGN